MTPERLKEWRVSRKLTVAKAGRLTGIHPRVWHRWEAGETKIKPWAGHVLRSVGDGLTPYK